MKHPSSHYRNVSTDILGIGCRYLGTCAANLGTTANQNDETYVDIPQLMDF